jgi:hypothetical protein
MDWQNEEELPPEVANHSREMLDSAISHEQVNPENNDWNALSWRVCFI